ncbi:hypothetical protein A6A40_19940 (plasmid) [Azospirillum humicireducens]|uniref:Uncharacterized protein n=1 Tax=Azospirillum humicireducens TaxID=1226968 RepID=A0A2R4VSA7_9PROT|nr:hypothetical protein A6A40_19940 [Azospirillum humicireducens]
MFGCRRGGGSVALASRPVSEVVHQSVYCRLCRCYRSCQSFVGKLVIFDGDGMGIMHAKIGQWHFQPGLDQIG